MTVRGEGEGGGKRTHRTTTAVLTLACLSIMFAQLSQETRESCQGGVSLTVKRTPNRVQYPCVQIQEYNSRHQDKTTREISVTPATTPCLHGTPRQEDPSDQCYTRYYSGPARDGHATTIMTVRGEEEGEEKRTHPTAATILTSASDSLMLAQLSKKTRTTCQGGVSLTAKQTPYRVRYPCEQMQDYTQTIKTPGQENPSGQRYTRYYSRPARDGHATTIMTVRGEGEGEEKRTHPTAATILTSASLSLMLAQLSKKTRGYNQEGVSLTVKQTTYRVQYPCVQIQ